MAEGLTQRQREALARQLALGRARVLAVGIDKYDASCGFDPLTTRRNDAVGFADCFRDIPQLHADLGSVRALVSGQGPAPSRGEIIKALREFVRSSEAGDRLIFYFSGRGHRIAGDPEVYLVPQDAYADDDASCLIPLSLVKKIINDSPAKQKLMVLDACLAGQVKAFDEYLRSTTGVAILASCAENVPAATRSPNPQHSLFTAFLLPALRGAEPGALDEKLLTVPSLYKFLARSMTRPIVNESASGLLVLADFSGPLLSADALEVDGALFLDVELSGSGQSVSVKEILTALSRTHYSQSHLEQRANAALGEYLEEELGRVVSRLRARFRWASSAVTVSGAGIAFPDGTYAVRYEATEKLRGVLVPELSLKPVWLDAAGQIADLLECLAFDAERVTFTLREGCVLARCVPKLEASGFSIVSELPHKIEAEHGEYTLILEERALTLVDFPLREMFAATPSWDAVRKAAAALAVFTGG